MKELILDNLVKSGAITDYKYDDMYETFERLQIVFPTGQTLEITSKSQYDDSYLLIDQLDRK